MEKDEVQKMQLPSILSDKPAYVPVTAWLRHAPFAFWLVHTMKPKRIVELGTHFGYSYFCFCQAVRSGALDTKCYAVDTWQGDEHAGLYDSTVFDAVTLENQRYQSFSKLIRKTFSEALGDIEDGSVDILHVDGRHFYEDVKEDFESWVPKLSKRAVVLFHDTEVHERDFGVWQYWSEISVKKPSLNFPFQHGLGVLFWGSEIAEGLRPLVEASADDEGRQAIIQQFGKLGEELANSAPEKSARPYLSQGKLTSAEGQLRAAQFKLENLNKRFEKANAKVKILQTQLAAARNNPFKQAKRKALFHLLSFLSKASPPFSQRRVDRFRNSAAKRDPDRNDFLQPSPWIGTLAVTPLTAIPTHFDPDWYVETYPDVAASFLDPLKHYMLIGHAEGRRINNLDQASSVTESRLEVIKAPEKAKEVVLFVTFAPAGKIKPHVLFYVEALKHAGLSVVLIIAADDLGSLEIGDIAGKVDGLYLRQNGGFDFAAWSHVSRDLDLSNTRLLCLANDSLVGPFSMEALFAVMDRIRNSEAELVGLTNNLELKEHLQSYFIVAKGDAVPSLLDFLRNVMILRDKWQVIFSYEIQLSDYFRSRGFLVETLFSSGMVTNRTVHNWRELIEEGFPFVKMEALQRTEPSTWAPVLLKKGYDVALAKGSVELIEKSKIGLLPRPQQK